MGMSELAESIVLRYDQGQFTFNHLDSGRVSDEQIYEIARRLNSFQECPLRKVYHVKSYRFTL